MDRTHTTGWAIGAGLVAGLVAGGAMQLLGYPFLAAGAALLSLCVVSWATGYALHGRTP